MMITKSRNEMTFERLKYYRHLAGGALECIASRLSKTPKPLCFSLMVTSRCNCDCDFCFWKSKKGTDDMPTDEIVRLLTEAGQIGYMDSILWGGEPLLREDFAEICKASHDAGLYTKIATNGWYLESNPDFAIKLNPDSAQFFPLIPYPGTQAFNWAKENNYIKTYDYSKWLKEDGNHECVLNLPDISSDELVEFCDYARRKFYLRPKYLIYKTVQSITNFDEMKRNLKAFGRLLKFIKG